MPQIPHTRTLSEARLNINGWLCQPHSVLRPPCHGALHLKRGVCVILIILERPNWQKRNAWNAPSDCKVNFVAWLNFGADSCATADEEDDPKDWRFTALWNICMISHIDGIGLTMPQTRGLKTQPEGERHLAKLLIESTASTIFPKNFSWAGRSQWAGSWFCNHSPGLEAWGMRVWHGPRQNFSTISCCCPSLCQIYWIHCFFSRALFASLVGSWILTGNRGSRYGMRINFQQKSNNAFSYKRLLEKAKHKDSKQ